MRLDPKLQARNPHAKLNLYLRRRPTTASSRAMPLQRQPFTMQREEPSLQSQEAEGGVAAIAGQGGIMRESKKDTGEPRQQGRVRRRSAGGVGVGWRRAESC